MPAKLFLNRLCQLADLEELDIDLVQSIPWSSVSVKRGRDILQVGDRPGYVYVIESGWAARYSVRRNGSRRITGFMLPGDFCGIHAVTGEAMEHAIVALTDCEVARVQANVIEQAVAVSPAIGKALWRAKLTDEAILRMWLLNSQDAETALAHLICELHTRADAIGAVRDGRFLVPVIQEQLGDALGLTAVHVNRMMKKLRLAGLVEFEGHEVIIPDIAALESACGFSPSYLHLPLVTGHPALAA
ncbi:Crp/Fnr family transcriptional regulator [Sphingomonas sp. XXL09]|uniref:Crp/Fnr family transcriptional regulator n=1 Tax=Sphingomonas sp. XXL09 TaxID=3457787 RepID=UPI00406BD322